jgi:hypothetical protein
MNRNVGTALAIAGIALLVITLVVSAAIAPSRVVAAADSNETVIGVQGVGAPGHVELVNGSTTAWRTDEAAAYFEVERLESGSFVAAFLADGYEACGEYDPPCSRTGFRILDPTSAPAVVSEWSFPVRTSTDSEVHAVEPLPSGGFAIADMEYERILVVEDGEVQWQWHASEHYDFPDDPTRNDWLHINDVNYLGNDRFLVSVRNANQLVVLERGTGVVEVINETPPGFDRERCGTDGEVADYDDDGEVRCGDPATLSRQHNPHWLGDGAVLVADSDNDRVVELHRTANGTWEPVWTVTGAGDLPFRWPRDADRLPSGNTLVSDTWNERVLEINETGHVRWSTATEPQPYEADRLPGGEPTGVPVYNGSGFSRPDGDPASGGGLPMLSTLVVVLHAVVPFLPFWIGELQLLAGLLSLGLVVVGAVLRYRAAFPAHRTGPSVPASGLSGIPVRWPVPAGSGARVGWAPAAPGPRSASPVRAAGLPRRFRRQDRIAVA